MPLWFKAAVVKYVMHRFTVFQCNDANEFLHLVNLLIIAYSPIGLKYFMIGSRHRLQAPLAFHKRPFLSKDFLFEITRCFH